MNSINLTCECPECENRRRKLEEYGEPEHTPEEARLLFKLRKAQDAFREIREQARDGRDCYDSAVRSLQWCETYSQQALAELEGV